MATKQLLLDQREMRKTLHNIEVAVEGGAREDLVESFGPTREAPRVSVVVTVYNYAALVTKAIESVAASEFSDYEVVIVDDASSDIGRAHSRGAEVGPVGHGQACHARAQRGLGAGAESR